MKREPDVSGRDRGRVEAGHGGRRDRRSRRVDRGPRRHARTGFVRADEVERGRGSRGAGGAGEEDPLVPGGLRRRGGRDSGAPGSVSLRAARRRSRQGTSIPIHAVDHAYFAYEDKANGVAFVASADVDLVPPDPKTPEHRAGRQREAEKDRDGAICRSPTPPENPIAPPSSDAIPPEGRPGPAGGRAGRRGRRGAGGARLEGGPRPIPEGASGARDRGKRRARRRDRRDGPRHRRPGRRGDCRSACRRRRPRPSASGVYRPARGPSGPIASRKSVRILFTLRDGR